MRNLNDWEVDRIVELLLRLGEFNGLTTEADGIRWKHDSDGKLSVCCIREIMTHSGGILGPWKQLWKGNTPTKVKCFTWVTVQVWHMVLSISQEPWVMPEHIADLLSCWMRRGGSKTQKRWWSIVPTCV
ncbi:hypothetical protein MTR67_051236, partial [Solanum verrucosum]